MEVWELFIFSFGVKMREMNLNNIFHHDRVSLFHNPDRSFLQATLNLFNNPNASQKTSINKVVKNIYKYFTS